MKLAGSRRDLVCVADRIERKGSQNERGREKVSYRDPPAILPRPIFLRFTRSSFPFSLPFGRLSRRQSRFQTSHQMATFLKRPPRSKKTNRFFVGTLIWQRATCKRCSIKLFLMNEFFFASLKCIIPEVLESDANWIVKRKVFFLLLLLFWGCRITCWLFRGCKKERTYRIHRSCCYPKDSSLA